MEWNLDDKLKYVLVHSFKFDDAFTYGDMRKGHRDSDKREIIRRAASENFSGNVHNAQWWAFRIFVNKKGRRPFDIENVPKLIIDSFCKKQITDDKSRYKHLALYEDDTIDHVRICLVAGVRGESNLTEVEIFARKNE